MVLSTVSNDVLCQQEWSYTQYLFNLYDVNSSYAGNHGTGSFAARYRSQWMGVEGAPVTQQFSWHAPVMDNKLGVGVRLQNESIGLRSQVLLLASCAYKLRINRTTISMGMAAGGIRQHLKTEDINARDQVNTYLNNIITPLLNISLFVNTDRFYAGIESARINRTSFSMADNSLARLYYNLNVTGGYMKKTGKDDMLQVSTLIKFSEGNLWQAELNVLFLKNNKFWFGAGYRYNTSIQVMGCIHISPQLRFGMSYDITTAPVQMQRSGSAEAFLGFTMKSRQDKSIRYF